MMLFATANNDVRTQAQWYSQPRLRVILPNGSDGETRYSDEKYNLKLTACETATIIIPNSEEYEKLS